MDQHELILRGLRQLKLVEEQLEDARHDFTHLLDVLEHTIEESDHAESKNLVIFFAANFKAFLSQLQRHVEGGDRVCTRELQLLERRRLLIHQVDDESEAAVEEAVEDATVFHQ